MDMNNFKVCNNSLQLMKMVLMLFTMNKLLTKCEKIKINNKKKSTRRWWVRPTFRDRSKKGYFTTMYKSIRAIDPEHFLLHTRMSRESYNILCSLIGPKLNKTSIRPSIEFECRLAITLSYLTQAASHQMLSWTFKVGKSTVREIIYEMVDIIWETLSPVYLKPPTTEEFQNIAEDFADLWNLPNCVGAIDGKHIAITQPKDSGSLYFNYKKFYSIILLAVCDARHRFTMVDVGAYGSQSDGGVFAASQFGNMLNRGEVPLPPAKLLPNSNIFFQHFYVADAAFQLNKNMMRPYPGTHLTPEKRVFNYRLSRARMLIENSFGIITSRFRILLTTINAYPRNTERIVLACVALHNFIITRDRDLYCPANYTDWEDESGVIHQGEWRSDAPDNSIPGLVGGNRCSRDAFNSRNVLSNYLSNEGAIARQNLYLNTL